MEAMAAGGDISMHLSTVEHRLQAFSIPKSQRKNSLLAIILSIRPHKKWLECSLGSLFFLERQQLGQDRPVRRRLLQRLPGLRQGPCGEQAQ